MNNETVIEPEEGVIDAHYYKVPPPPPGDNVSSHRDIL